MDHPNIELAEKVSAYATRHRMMFGASPDYDLFIEVVKALQAGAQENVASKGVAGKRAARKETEE